MTVDNSWASCCAKNQSLATCRNKRHCGRPTKQAETRAPCCAKIQTLINKSLRKFLRKSSFKKEIVCTYFVNRAMLKVQDKPFTNIEDTTKIKVVTQNVVGCTVLHFLPK